MEVITILLLISIGFIAGFIFNGILARGARADELALMGLINLQRTQLKEADDTIYELSTQNASLKDNQNKEVA